MSRKGSGKGKKGSAKSPKVQIKELTEQNALLTEQLIALQNEQDQLKNKLECTVRKVLEGVNRREFGVREGVNPLDIGTDMLINMVGKMIVRKRISDMSVEARVEQLETRVTEMSMQLARMTMKTVAYENGLGELLNCSSVEQVRDRVFQLQLIAGQEYHSFGAEENLCEERSNSPPSSMQPVLPTINGVSSQLSRVSMTPDSVRSRPPSAADRIREDAARLNLVPPPKRLPGDTQLKYMHRDLRLLVMKELSLEKPSGADWRMLAERVGIPEDTTRYWRSLRLECPMGRVMAEWGESPSATVRMLHRHLFSPQMRCTLLAKRISDFYEVD